MDKHAIELMRRMAEKVENEGARALPVHVKDVRALLKDAERVVELEIALVAARARENELRALVSEQEVDIHEYKGSLRERAEEIATLRRKLESMEDKLRARGLELHDLRAVAQRGLGILHGTEE